MTPQGRRAAARGVAANAARGRPRPARRRLAPAPRRLAALRRAPGAGCWRRCSAWARCWWSATRCAWTSSRGARKSACCSCSAPPTASSAGRSFIWARGTAWSPARSRSALLTAADHGAARAAGRHWPRSYGSSFALHGFDPLQSRRRSCCGAGAAGLARRRPRDRSLPAPDPADFEATSSMTRHESHDLRHLANAAPRIMVVDGSKLVRKLIGDVLTRELPSAIVVALRRHRRGARGAGRAAPSTWSPPRWCCPTATASRWRARCARRPGRPTCRSSWSPATRSSTWNRAASPRTSPTTSTRRSATARWPPSSAATCSRSRSRARACSTSRTARWSRWRPSACSNATACTVLHFVGVEEALGIPRDARAAQDDSRRRPGADRRVPEGRARAATTCCERLRNDFGYGKRRLPVLVMTGDANADNQSALLRAGANDLVLKPIEERLLVTKTAVPAAPVAAAGAARRSDA